MTIETVWFKGVASEWQRLLLGAHSKDALERQQAVRDAWAKIEIRLPDIQPGGSFRKEILQLLDARGHAKHKVRSRMALAVSVRNAIIHDKFLPEPGVAFCVILIIAELIV